jgi:ParB family chromosome partitioning protein
LVAENNESGRQVQRYIRLTELIPPILQMVDDRRIAFSPAIELSYLAEKEQLDLLETMESEDCTPSLSQAQRMKKLSQDGKLDMDMIFAIMTEEKPNQKEQIKLPKDRIKKFFPKDYTAKQMEEVIMKLLADWQRKRERSRNTER